MIFIDIINASEGVIMLLADGDNRAADGTAQRKGGEDVSALQHFPSPAILDVGGDPCQLDISEPKSILSRPASTSLPPPYLVQGTKGSIHFSGARLLAGAGKG
ncbi:hypothetical protein E2C01_095742 [Portunus trituberculatus]|uniref:Uncharacterized protein n=1 Tax=Portunus trituberculatus TaxID=210409 RepID=A0A5B7JTT6_PORTR|nr:hypothetical protein [Portunus trituberculatus]